MLDASFTHPSVNPQPWQFTNNSLGLPHAHSLSVCLFLWVCVVCVCFLLFLSFYLCCKRCVFCVRFCIHDLFFAFFLLFLRIEYTYVTVPIDVLIALLISLSSASFYISTFVIHAYVYVNLYTHFPPFLYSYTFIAIFICIHVPTILYDPLYPIYSNYNTSLCTCS